MRKGHQRASPHHLRRRLRRLHRGAAAHKSAGCSGAYRVVHQATRLDCRLYEPPAPGKAAQMGRPRKWGRRLPPRMLRASLGSGTRARPWSSVPSMFDSLEVRLRLSSAEVKSSARPDGGEGLARRKGDAARRASEGSAGAKPRPDEQKLDRRQPWPDERARDREVHIHQGPWAVNPAGVRGRLSGLPREVCAVSRLPGLGGP